MTRAAELADEREVEADPAEGAGARDQGERRRRAERQRVAERQERVGGGADERARDHAGPPPAAEGPVAHDAPGEPARRACASARNRPAATAETAKVSFAYRTR